MAAGGGGQAGNFALSLSKSNGEEGMNWHAGGTKKDAASTQVARTEETALDQHRTFHSFSFKYFNNLLENNLRKKMVLSTLSPYPKIQESKNTSITASW